VVLLMLFARVVIPGIIAAITGPSWPTHVSHSASYTVPGIDPALLPGRPDETG
jgi:Tfp pilus assembly protein PilE